MLVSVIIPVFNGAATLERTLKAFLAQKMGAGQQFEIVLCDDGSTDASPGILARYDHDPRVRVVFQDNRGQSAATNRAAHLARGELLVFAAQDIVPADRHFLRRHVKWHQKLPGERCVTGYIRYPEEIITSDFMVFMRDSRHQFDYQDIPVPDDIDPMKLYAPNFSVKKPCFCRAGGFDEAFRYGFQDTDLGIRLHRSGLKISLLDNLDCLHYHALELDTSAASKRGFGRVFIDFYRKHKNYLEAYGQPSVRLSNLMVRCFKLLMNKDLLQRIYLDIMYCQDSNQAPLYELYDEFSWRIGKLPELTDDTILFENKLRSRQYVCKYFFYSAILTFSYFQGVVERAVELGFLQDAEFDLTPLFLAKGPTAALPHQVASPRALRQ